MYLEEKLTVESGGLKVSPVRIKEEIYKSPPRKNFSIPLKNNWSIKNKEYITNLYSILDPQLQEIISEKQFADWVLKSSFTS